MPDVLHPEVRNGTSVLDADARTAIREILAQPSLPAAVTVAGPGGFRAAALREAIDHLVSLKLLAVGLRSAAAGPLLLAALAELDAELAQALRRHVELVDLLIAAEPGPARNAVLGDVARGDVLTWAPQVRSWAWGEAGAPSVDSPLARVTGEFVVDDFPGLYTHLLVRDPGSGAVAVVPTHRARVSWAPDGDGRGVRDDWVVTLAGVSVHVHELLSLDHEPQGR